jgi:hypothetical protein
MNREMKAYRDSITGGVPADWSYGGDRLSIALDHQIHGMLRARRHLAMAGRIHGYSMEIVTRKGTGNHYRPTVTGGEVHGHGHGLPLAACEQHGDAGREAEHCDRIHPLEGRQGFLSLILIPPVIPFANRGTRFVENLDVVCRFPLPLPERERFGSARKAVSQLLWSHKDREKRLSSGENHERRVWTKLELNVCGEDDAAV